MLKVKINMHEWTIQGISKEELNNKYIESHEGEFGKGLYAFGLCEFKSRIIYINEELEKHQLISTLKHELTHAYLWSVGMQYDKFEEEDIANIVSASNDIINEIVSLYLEKESDTDA